MGIITKKYAGPDHSKNCFLPLLTHLVNCSMMQLTRWVNPSERKRDVIKSLKTCPTTSSCASSTRPGGVRQKGIQKRIHQRNCPGGRDFKGLAVPLLPRQAAASTSMSTDHLSKVMLTEFYRMKDFDERDLFQILRKASLIQVTKFTSATPRSTSSFSPPILRGPRGKGRAAAAQFHPHRGHLPHPV